MTCLTVAANNPFVEDGLLLEGGLIEHVAQSSAVDPGMRGRGPVNAILVWASSEL